jgi:alpha-beta hydrolase superfamily lysophospholipase
MQKTMNPRNISAMNASRKNLPTYQHTHESWRRAHDLLAESLRMRPDQTPREEWLRVGRFEVHLDRHGRDDAPATLVLVHGGGGNGRLLAPYGCLAAEHGFAAVAPDLPGYGLTRQRRKRSIVYEDWRTVLTAVVEDTARRNGRPVVLFGLSMGGMLAYDVAARTRIPAALVTTCLLDPRLPEVRRQMVRAPWLATLTEWSLRVPWLTDHGVVKMNLVGNMKAIANDPRISRALSRDRRAGGTWMPGRWIRTFLTSDPVVEPEAFDVCPVLLAHPAEDRWTDVAVSRPFFDRLVSTPTELVMLERSGHFPIEAPGRDVLADLLVDRLRTAAATTAA